METTKLGLTPAFPENEQSGNPEIWNLYPGMTKRFYAACAAMQGMLSNPNIKRPHPQDGNIREQTYAFIAIAYEYADELLKHENE